MNLINNTQTIASPTSAPLVNNFAAPSVLQADLRASAFKPVSQVAPTQGQTAHLNPGTVFSPLHNAVQAYGFESDVAASLLTYNANGKMVGSGRIFNSHQDPELGNPNAAVSPDTISDDPAVEVKKQKEQAIQEKEHNEIRMLATRDAEVRAHEQAHAAIGGPYAGAPKYQFEQGPNGVNYAVGGEVPIDVGPAATPELTIEKAQTVRRAAMAPAEPSPQDRQVAQQATQLEATARQQMATERAQSSDGDTLESDPYTDKQAKNTQDVLAAKQPTDNQSESIDGLAARLAMAYQIGSAFDNNALNQVSSNQSSSGSSSSNSSSSNSSSDNQGVNNQNTHLYALA